MSQAQDKKDKIIKERDEANVAVDLALDKVELEIDIAKVIEEYNNAHVGFTRSVFVNLRNRQVESVDIYFNETEEKLNG